MYTMAATAMSTVSMSIVGAYMTMKVRASSKCWVNTFWQVSRLPLSLPVAGSGFIALIALNGTVCHRDWLVGQHLLPGHPGLHLLSDCMGDGVPSSEALQVGSIMATKLVSNKFVAMMDLQNCFHALSACGRHHLCVLVFSYFSSIGLSWVRLRPE